MTNVVFKRGEVCVLRKGIYGLRTSPLRFFWHLNKFLLSERYGLVQCLSDPCLYRHKTKDPWLALYVDDALLKGESGAVAELEGLLNEDFKCRSYGEPKSFLGMDIDCDHKADTIHISQRTYIRNLVDRFGPMPAKLTLSPMDSEQVLTRPCDGSKPCDATEYRQLVGCLVYASVLTSGDIAHSVCMLSEYVHAPTERRTSQARRTLAWLASTPDYGPAYGKSSVLSGWCDADFCGGLDTRRSCSGQILFLNGGPICLWSRTKTKKTLFELCCVPQKASPPSHKKQVRLLTKSKSRMRTMRCHRQAGSRGGPYCPFFVVVLQYHAGLLQGLHSRGNSSVRHCGQIHRRPIGSKNTRTSAFVRGGLFATQQERSGEANPRTTN